MGRFIAVCLGLLILAYNTNVYAGEKGIAVLELFTTQACTRALPVDAIIKNIADERDEKIITLSCHVTYLSSSPTKDPFSEEFCDDRHKVYYRALSLDGTAAPQIVINGEFDTKGSSEKTVRAGIKLGQSLNTVSPVELSFENGTIKVSLPEKSLEEPADVWLFAYDRLHKAEYPKAHNAPEITVEYVNVTRHLEKLMTWDGSDTGMSYSLTDIQADGYALIAQYQGSQKIIAAGKVEKN